MPLVTVRSETTVIGTDFFFDVFGTESISCMFCGGGRSKRMECKVSLLRGTHVSPPLPPSPTFL